MRAPRGWRARALLAYARIRFMHFHLRSMSESASVEPRECAWVLREARKAARGRRAGRRKK